MTTTMTALSSANINHAEFIRMIVGKTSPTTYTFCNAAGPVTVSGITFSGLGSLLSLGDIQQDIKASSDDLMIALVGIDPANISLILSSDIKGSSVEVWRGFLDSDNQIITSPSTQFFKRYTGIISNVSITEDWNDQLRSRTATCSISCCSMRKVLDSRVAGMRTNQKSWQFVYGSSETSMNRVSLISNQFFDFGSPPMGGSVSNGTNGGEWKDGGSLDVNP